MGKHTSGFSLPGFACLAPSIFVQDAARGIGGHSINHGFLYSDSSFFLPPGPAAKLSSRSRDIAPPDLIIITSWTGAASKHVAKYTEAYNTLYPGVPILVITTVISDLVIHSTNHKLQALAPAVDYILSREPVETAPYQTDSTSLQSYDTYSPPPPPPPTTTKPRFPSLLLHAFSEGGAHKAVLLARAYQQHHTHTHPPPPPRIPVQALLLDSTPGTASYTRATTAFARALPGGAAPNTLVGRVLAPAASAGVVGFMWAGLREDEVVAWADVHRHGVESARCGLTRGGEGGSGRAGSGFQSTGTTGGGVGDGAGADVEGVGAEGGGAAGVGSLMVRFKRTEHCAHAKGVVNGGVYWAAVRRTWEMRVDGGMGLRMGLGRRLSLDSLCLGEYDECG
ncbi:hypothetical protein CHGG_09968 [Chaetomium globosum CBS 148.51]|uniref:Uncharacterized protein n=1 Tax=Chaetomium globosum (strain ATCC 6205 / CBS 148.51 / DSM 1962 / NBRC 6347 / NRRL 1970) TaxID=306901 RepID=Q2GPY6_CHAGB|nr:uncharacterized protein CHGG_09968 [Chaetomium globosum CBS 148.51]EAQ83564.1 hypothetical protein CHGG_09968 [Chaetomium globosum CBS 148.51]